MPISSRKPSFDVITGQAEVAATSVQVPDNPPRGKGGVTKQPDRPRVGHDTENGAETRDPR